jgi:predicted DNA-binding transcriptional regulator YafY
MKPKRKKSSSKEKGPKNVRMTGLMIERQQAIHFALFAKTYPTSGELAVELEVKEKTVRRDIERMINRMNLPIDWNYKEKGWHYTSEVALFPSVLITEEEIISMVIAVNALKSSMFAGIGRHLVMMFDKIVKGLPKEMKAIIEQWEDAVTFHYLGEPKFDPEIFRTMVHAIAKRDQVLMHYATPNKKSRDRLFDPYGMALVIRQWVCFGHDHKENELRRFIPPRMRKVELNGKKFVRPPGFKTNDQLTDTVGVYNGEKHIYVVLRFAKKIANEPNECHWPRFHKILKNRDGTVDLHLRITHLHDIHEVVMSRGGDIVPLHPPELIEMFHDAGEKIMATRGQIPNPPPATDVFGSGTV